MRLVVTVFDISNMPWVACQALPCGQDTLSCLPGSTRGAEDIYIHMGCSDSSEGRAFALNAADQGSIPPSLSESPASY